MNHSASASSSRKLGHTLSALMGALVLGCMTVGGLALAAVTWIDGEALQAQQALAERHQLVLRWQAEIRITNDAALSAVMNTNPVSQGVLDQRVQAGAAAIAELSAQLGRAQASEAEKQAMDQVQQQGSQVAAAIAKLQQTKAAGELARAVLGVNRELKPLVEAQLKSLQAYSAQVAQATADQAQAYEAQRREVLWLALAGAAVAVALGLGLGLRISRQIARDIEAGLRTAEAIASGDLGQAVQSQRRDELGDLVRALERMRQGLGGTLRDIQHSVGQMATATREIASGNQDLHQRSEQAADELKTTADAMYEIHQGMQQAANAAVTARHLAEQTSEVANRGGAVVGEVVSTMDQITQASRRITDIVGVIDGIAFQTNILALNAAVEAARAGEDGRGFAVVAGEVRTLAQRSAAAAREIKSLIGGSVERVEDGSRLVTDAGQTMREIVAGVAQVSEAIRQISDSTASQSQGIESVNGAIGQLDEVTRENTRRVQDSTAAAQALQHEAHHLAEAVDRFRLAAV